MKKEMTPTRKYCGNCKDYNLAFKKTPNHILHLILSLLTGGAWLIVWFILILVNFFSSPRCSKCGY